MKPTRQLECVGLMVATQAELLVEGTKMLKVAGSTPEQVAKMDREMVSVQGPYKDIERIYGQDLLNLVLAKGDLAKLLESESVLFDL